MILNEAVQLRKSIGLEWTGLKQPIARIALERPLPVAKRASLLSAENAQFYLCGFSANPFDRRR